MSSRTTLRCGAGAAGRALLAMGLIAVLSACGSTKPVKFTVHSEPPGGYVLMQVRGAGGGDADWVYLGNTPVVTVRQMDMAAIESAQSVALRIMREGFFEQTKEWGGKTFNKETEEKGTIFWNPKLVPANPR